MVAAICCPAVCEKARVSARVHACVRERTPSAGNYFDGIGSDGLNGSESVSEHRQLITIH